APPRVIARPANGAPTGVLPRLAPVGAPSTPAREPVTAGTPLANAVSVRRRPAATRVTGGNGAAGGPRRGTRAEDVLASRRAQAGPRADAPRPNDAADAGTRWWSKAAPVSPPPRRAPAPR